MGTLSQSFYVKQFQEFYQEIAKFKHLAHMAPRTASSSLSTEDALGGVPPYWQEVVLTIQELANKAGNKGGPCTSEAYKEFLFLLVALADDVFLHLEWSGKKGWQANLLESKFFHTAVAGERVFQQIERLLETRPVGCAEMAVVYLMALALGFRGKYWGTDDHGKLEEYRRELYALAFHQDPDLTSSSHHVFPEAYTHVLKGGRVKTLPNPHKWLVGLTIGGVTFVILAHGVWLRVTGKISQLVQEILSFG